MAEGADPGLSIEVIEGPILTPGTKYIINSTGYPESKRGVRDGCVHIGTKPHNEEKGEYTNDIVVSQDELGMGGEHLLIQYQKAVKGYYIKDKGQGTGTFLMVEKPLELKQGYIITYGDSSMVVKMEIGVKIQLKFLDGPKAEQTLYLRYGNHILALIIRMTG